MTLASNKSIAVSAFILLFTFCSCNKKNNPRSVLTKEDSTSIALAIFKLNPQIFNVQNFDTQPRTAKDTIKLPVDLKADILENVAYTFNKSGNFLSTFATHAYRGFTIKQVFSGEVDVPTVDTYVRNYKDWVNNGAAVYTRQYSYILQKADVLTLCNLTGAQGIRVYMGIPVANKPDSQTVILTAFNSTGGDIYITKSNGPFAIDQASPCPKDCPYKYSDGNNSNGPISTKLMLGRVSGKDQ